MHEVFPVTMGVLVGLLATRLAGWRRVVAVVTLSVLVGVLASAVSGELAVSWGFILVDMGQVLMVALMTAVLVMLWQRRAKLVR
jgi:hypothetical protein